ncbi:hypothetical protein PEP31012_04637 [Pandoraea eparura]|uniref:Uncharacterized protein n=2 Tax=Pandoraea eparura TaxID=2508291 RepID=A0A5E4YMJ1_9BURK|nr:hypothetical protein PEP31012_04637 [Pandoraea eparura]
MRHAVELYLKDTALQLVSLAAHRKATVTFDLDGSHDIGKIWQHIVSHSQAIDRRYAPLLTELHPYIDDLEKIDATGQVFRYPFSNLNKKHLEDVAVINVIVLKQRFGELIELLKQLNYLNSDLGDEYRLGTFTNVLSRKDLFEIAKMLPPRAQWSHSVFSEAKDSIREKYVLSMKQFCVALDKIQGHYEMADIIGAPLELPNLPRSELFVFFDCWVNRQKKNSTREKFPDEDVLGSDGFIEVMKRDFLEEDEDWRKLKGQISPDTLAQIRAVYGIGYEKAGCELHPHFFDSLQKELNYFFRDDSKKYRARVLHYLRKSRLIECVVRGLKYMGQSALSLEVEGRYLTANTTQAAARNYGLR